MRMTGKEAKLIEALNKCDTQKSYENVRYTLIDDELRAYIEESLERLKVLEIENRRLNIILDDTKSDYLKTLRERENLKQENEKLKKVIEIIKNKRVNLNLLFQEPNTLEAYNNYCLPIYKLTQQEYELLNEVLGNA